MASNRKDRIDTTQAEAGGFGGLASALAQAGLSPTRAPDPPEAPKVAAPAPPPSTKGEVRLSGKVVLRVQRKGRGGKTVTLIEGLRLPPSALEALGKELRRTLGCGVSPEGEALVVQGDQADRLRPLLLARGAKQVV